MKRKMNFYLLIFGLFQFSEVFSQEVTWLKDSLTHYEGVFWSEVKAQKPEDAKKTVSLILNKGSEDLSPDVFEFFESTLQRSKEIQFPLVLGQLEIGLGTLEYYRGDITAAKEAFKRAKTIYSAAKMLNETAGMAMNIGIMQEKGGFYDSAISNYEEALTIFKLQNDSESLGSVNQNIGLTYYKTNKFNKALEFYAKADSALGSYLDSLDSRWVGLYLNKHLAMNGLSRQSEGLEILLKAMRIAEHNEDPILQGKIYIQLYTIYTFMGEREKAFNALMESKTKMKNNQNLQDIANLNYNLSKYYLDEKKSDSAAYYAKLALEFFEKYGFTKDTADAYGLLGSAEFDKENYKEAIRYFEKALIGFEDKGSQGFAGYLFNIGFANTKLGNSQSGIEYLERSLEIRKTLNLTKDLRDSYQGLAEAYERTGNYKQAFENLTLYQIYKDSVFNETKNKQLAELETQYEAGKKDQSIADLEKEKQLQNLRSQKQQTQIYFSLGGLVILLGVAGLLFRQSSIRKKYNNELEIKNKEIAKQNAEREVLLKEIHHRVKNNLQIISSLLSMQTRGLKDDKMKDAMKESQSRVKTMSLIHEKLYQYENLSKINMQEYIQQLSEFLTQTYRLDKNIKINIDAADINLDIDTALPLGLITNELLSNSLKYAFVNQDEGEINISFSQLESGAFKLLVTDSGVGLDENLDIDATKSLGLKLVRTLTRQINGELRITHQPGATFEIAFNEEKLAA